MLVTLFPIEKLFKVVLDYTFFRKMYVSTFINKACESDKKLNPAVLTVF